MDFDKSEYCTEELLPIWNDYHILWRADSTINTEVCKIAIIEKYGEDLYNKYWNTFSCFAEEQKQEAKKNQLEKARQLLGLST
jgi:UTP-glucose-1-phosphate uridylyltransferase